MIQKFTLKRVFHLKNIIYFLNCKGVKTIFLLENLYFLKKKYKLRWNEIAEKSNISYRTLQDIIYKDTINPSIDTVDKLAKFFNVTIDELYNKKLF